MAIQKTQAIVLNNQDFRESSLLATFYTKDFGKLKGLIKGIRASKSRFGSRLEPFSFNTIVFYENRKSSFCIIAQCDRAYNFNIFQGDLEKAAYASYLVELIDAVTSPGDANTLLFELLFNTLRLLSHIEIENIEEIIRIFEIRLLDISGFMPRLDCCVCCGKNIFLLKKKPPHFSHSLGGLICEACFAQDKAALSISLGTIASLKYIESTEWCRVLHFKISSAIKEELEEILRCFLSLHLERKFKSLAFLEKVRNFHSPNSAKVRSKSVIVSKRQRVKV
jgi:DNA repair protein RecO (recombination protein O)